MPFITKHTPESPSSHLCVQDPTLLPLLSEAAQVRLVKHWAAGYVSLQEKMYSMVVVGGTKLAQEPAGPATPAATTMTVALALERAKALLSKDNTFCIGALKHISSAEAKGILFQACRYEGRGQGSSPANAQME